MKLNTLFLIAAALTAFIRAELITIDGVDYVRSVQVTDGEHREELVRIPEGADPASFAEIAVPIHHAPEVEHAPRGVLTIVPTEQGAFLAFSLAFGEFRELVPAPRWTVPVVAQDGGEIMPEQEPGIIERSLQVAKDNPVPTGIAAFLALDYLEGDGIDLFGIMGGDSDVPATVVHVSGQGNSVTVSRDNNSDNSNRSNNPQTAAPFFPPPAPEQ